MFINKELWQPECIVKGIARIPTNRAHCMIWMAMLSGIFCLIGFLCTGPLLKAELDKLPKPLLLMGLGFMGFALFFPLPYIIYLAKELQKTKEQVEELANRKAEHLQG